MVYRFTDRFLLFCCKDGTMYCEMFLFGLRVNKGTRSVGEKGYICPMELKKYAGIFVASV